MELRKGWNRWWSPACPAAHLVASLLVLGLLSSVSTPVFAQTPAEVRARVSVDSVKIGERFTLSVVAESPGATDVVFPAASAGATVFGDLEVVSRSPVHTERPSSTRRVDSVAYEVAAFTLDSVQIPVLPVRIVRPGDTTVAGTTPRLVSVVSVVGPDARGLRTPATLASFPRPLWLWAVVAVAGLALLGAGTYAWWHFRAEGSAAPQTDEEWEDPYQAALSELQQLSRRNPNDRVSGKAFYVELSQALRLYVARRVGVSALECTTSELVAVLRRTRNVPEGAAQRIEPVLERADFVKFAGAKPDPEESQAVLREARGVLDSIEAAQRRTERTAKRASAAT